MKKRIQYGVPAAQPQSTLLTLTPELRNRIYHYVFTVPEERGAVIVRRPSPTSDRHTVLAFLATCRQVLDEAEGLFYHLNHFRVRRPRHYSFLKRLGAPRASSLKFVSFVVGSPEELVAALKTLRSASRLERLDVGLRGFHTKTPEAIRAIFQRGWFFVRRVVKQFRHLKRFRLRPTVPGGFGKGRAAEVRVWESKMKALMPSFKASWTGVTHVAMGQVN